MEEIKKRREYADWEYQIDSTSKKNKYSIIPNPPIPLPEFLYKYYTLCPSNIECLINSQFYVSEPFDFNDIFDTSIHNINFNLSDSEYRQLIYGSNTNNKSNAIPTTDQKEEAKKDLITLIFNPFFRECGILCFSGTIDNEILWGYYNSNKGYSIELNNYIGFGNEYSDPFPINYVKKLQKIEFNEQFDILGILILITTKKKVWCIENEFRMLVRSDKNGFNSKVRFPKTKEIFDTFKTNRFAKYPTKCIRRIILGHKFLEDENAQNYGNTIYIELISPQKCLKKMLFDFSLAKEIGLAMIHQGVQILNIVPRDYKLEQLDDYKYKMTSFN
jgi:hypothetical protein